MFLKILKVILFLLATTPYCLAYENDFGPDYGNRWFLFVDDNGTTHEVNFSSLPAETRGLFLGKAYCYLYTRNNKEDGELLTAPKGDSEIKSKYFNPSNAIKAITHGWLSSEKADWLQNIKNTLLTTADLNIITVEWSEIARNPLYPWPAFSTRYVGKHLARVLNSLMKTYNASNMHLIGHSLGAHVMGYAGMFSDKPVLRITGLDPARPLFEIPLMPPEYRLEKSDAQFVDIVHTCGGVYGYKKSHGHADYYPNSGKPPQPGCEGLQQQIEGCSHGRSHEYFLESIITDIGFFSYPCEDWNEFRTGHCRSNPTLMGYLANKSYVGDYFLNTNNHSEYACGQ